MPLFMAGAQMVHYFPVSIPYHGSALNITVHSYAGLLEFGLTACRRVLSQDESYELIEHLKKALKEIEALPPVTEAPAAQSATPPAELTIAQPAKSSGKAKAASAAKPEAAGEA